MQSIQNVSVSPDVSIHVFYFDVEVVCWRACALELLEHAIVVCRGSESDARHSL